MPLIVEFLQSLAQGQSYGDFAAHAQQTMKNFGLTDEQIGVLNNGRINQPNPTAGIKALEDFMRREIGASNGHTDDNTIAAAGNVLSMTTKITIPPT
jgi:hypothetical protein